MILDGAEVKLVRPRQRKPSVAVARAIRNAKIGGKSIIIDTFHGSLRKECDHYSPSVPVDNNRNKQMCSRKKGSGARDPAAGLILNWT